MTRPTPACLAILAVFCLTGSAHAVYPPLRNGIPYPGYGPENLALGGMRSLGLEDPVCILTNPSGVSGRLGCRLLSAAYGPVISDAEYTDNASSHSDSWVSGLGSTSMGMRIEVIESLSLGIGAASSADMPFRTAYYIPEGGDSLQGSMEIQCNFAEADLGLAWDAADWLVLGGAVGLRVYEQNFHISTEEPDYNIRELGYGWDEMTFRFGATVPLKEVTLGASWSSPDDYTPRFLAAGGMVNVLENLTVGAEMESAVLDEAEVLTERFFCIARPAGNLTLRTGLFHTAYTEWISREGLGFGCGAGYTIGMFTINAGFSWSPVKGEFDHYGYDGMESYEGGTTIISLGATLDRLH
ncbi:MAG: hypothetical protein JXA64_04270 [Candidatus Fermentibacteraceae bacterium]|nr:hypothetical protein [Candidatus Fermentibacteraceae bacterium]MBN2608308.1 hypothetical protein [Candidatus Fermentibacteraceae bacterium]